MRHALAPFLLIAACSESPAVPDGATPPPDAGVAIEAGDGGFSGPAKLSETGLYIDFNARKVDPRLLTFVPRYELWSDGAEKMRWMYLPEGMQIDTSDPDNWRYPVGTKFWKEFKAEGKVVETRLIQKMVPGEGMDVWFKMAYAWLPDGSDAIAAPDGVVNALGTEHDIPSQLDCDRCHGNTVVDGALGPGVIQLSTAAKNGFLTTLGTMNKLTTPLSEVEVPGDDLQRSALGYLHGNCSHCHNDVSWLQKQTILSFRVHVADTDATKTAAYKTAPFLRMKHLMEHHPATDSGPGLYLTFALVPGAPDLSGMTFRMGHRDLIAMPPVCTKKVDNDGLFLVKTWIASMKCVTCQYETEPPQ